MHGLITTWTYYGCEFAIVAKFGDHMLRHLASSFSNVIRQADKNSSLGDF